MRAGAPTGMDLETIREHLARMHAEIAVNGAALAADPAGLLWWPDRAVAVVADLHLEKGSGFAARGRMVPPHDTAATLSRLEAAVARLAPRTVICLGDSFHDRGAGARVAPADAARIARLAGGREWIWIVGNHDPEPPTDWGGRVEREVRLGPLVFRHQAAGGAGASGEGAGEVSGHYHPVAAVRTRGRRLRCRCFVTDGSRLVLPAFGAYAGGLNVRDPAVERLFRRGYEALLVGRDAIYRFPRARLSPDADAA